MLLVGLGPDQSDTDRGPGVKNSVIVDKSSYDLCDFNSLTFYRTVDPLLHKGDLRLDGHQSTVVRTTEYKGSLQVIKSLSKWKS